MTPPHTGDLRGKTHPKATQTQLTAIESDKILINVSVLERLALKEFSPN